MNGAAGGDSHYSVRQAAYDLRKLRAKELVLKPGRSRRYKVPTEPSARSSPSPPFATGSSSRSSPVFVPPPRPNARTWTAVEHDYHALCLDMETLFGDLGIAA